MHRHGTPILTYHSIDRSGSVISIAPELFRFQIESLASRGLRGVSLSTLLSIWNRDEPAHGVVALTFDDGFANNLDEAVPVLQQYSFSATVFVVAGRLGGDNQWPGQGGGIPQLPLLSVQALRALPPETLEVGSHTLDHPDLTTLNPAEAERQLVGGRQRLEELLGRAVTTFAYPLGRATPQIVKRAREIYQASCSTWLTQASPLSDRGWLPRLDAYYLRPRRVFAALGTPLVANYIRLRGRLRALRDPATMRPIADNRVPVKTQ